MLPVIDVAGMLVGILALCAAIYTLYIDQKSRRAAILFALVLIVAMSLLVANKDTISRSLDEVDLGPQVIASIPPADAGKSDGTPWTVEVLGAIGWTDTHIDLASGQLSTISGQGAIQFSIGGALTSPNGSGIACANDEMEYHRPFPASQLPCHSLIGRIGSSGAIFEIGSSGHFRAATAGRLDLGSNDNFLQDNSGSWTATIVLR
jgi:hypothetical protein